MTIVWDCYCYDSFTIAETPTKEKLLEQLENKTRLIR